MENTIDICPKCTHEIKEGELTTGLSWNGEGGEHIVCPEPIVLETNEDERRQIQQALAESLVRLGA